MLRDIARKLVDFLDRGQAAQAKQSLTDGLSMEQRVLADGLSQYQRGAVYVEQIMLSTWLESVKGIIAI